MEHFIDEETGTTESVPATARLILVSGERGSGKTTALWQAARLVTDRKGRCAGILCRSERTPEGLPYRITASSLESGETRALAERGPGARIPFNFEMETFDWADSVLRQAAQRTDTTLFLDEVGPLEIDRSEGFHPFLEWYLERGRGCLAVAIRPSLLSRFRDIVMASGSGIWTMTDIIIQAENRDKVPQMIAESLFPVADGQ